MIQIIEILLLTFLLPSCMLIEIKSVEDKSNASVVPQENKVVEIDVIGDANKFLKKDVLGLIPRTRTAPSGDMHDYFSLSPYFWPDPSKPDGLPYIYRDGQFNPERREFDELKLFKLVRAVSTLTQAYQQTGDVRYADKAVEWLVVWFLSSEKAMNPNMNFAQQVPGLSRQSPSGIIEARVLIDLIKYVKILKTSNVISSSTTEGISAWSNPLP